MAPRNFSEDGAFGAGGDGSTPSPSAGSPTGGFSVSDAGSQSPAPTSAPSAPSGGGGGYSAPSYQPPKPKTPDDYPVGSSQWQSQFIQDTTGITHPEFLQNTGGMQTIASFSQGGAIPEGDDDYDGNGSPAQERMQRALSNIEGVLAFGRKLHGLGGGDNEGAINTAGAMPTIPGNQSQTPGPYKPQPRPQQQAANMPTRPAGQSESGIPPLPPGPGTLPPTSNPFGKRADNDQDDSGGAIDTDEDTA